jgi:light-regulated signal transduction histidine kinase (bacteriophytochrome)
MLAMLNGMLRITRIAHSDVRRVAVDVSRLASELCDGLKASEPWRKVKIRVAPAMTAHADPRFVETALDELLRNAWKFTGGREHASIEIGSEETTRGQAFFVRDNGAGFDPAHKSKLFRVFQRLHGKDEFEGRGIGLAVVQRIIHLHGGHVWAVGGANEGATFYFTLPEDTD